MFGQRPSCCLLTLLCGELGAIKAAAPALKYCHGKDFKEEHWSALLQGKLGLSKDVRLETLTVGHFTASLRILGAPLRRIILYSPQNSHSDKREHRCLTRQARPKPIECFPPRRPGYYAIREAAPGAGETPVSGGAPSGSCP